jgi:hypothetical protein
MGKIVVWTTPSCVAAGPGTTARTAPTGVAHHRCEYSDCALLTCVSPSNEAATTKSTTIGIGILPFSLSSFLLASHMSVLRKEQNERRRPGAFL